MKAIVDVIIPVLICLLIVYALIKRVNVYEVFIEGAAEALPALLRVLPYLGAMLMAIAVFRGSGALALLVDALSPALSALGIPAELTPLIALRPFSGSASLALLQDTLLAHGADTEIGRAASTLVGSTETIFYTTAVYFGAVGISKTRHAVPAALISGALGSLAAVVFSNVFG